MITIGLGAIIGTVLAIPLLERGYGIGLLGPFLGAIAAGLIRRMVGVKKPGRSTTAGDKPELDDVASRPARFPLVHGFLFLVLGPTIAGAIGYFVLDEPPETPFFAQVMLLGLLVGLVGLVGSLLVDCA